MNNHPPPHNNPPRGRVLPPKFKQSLDLAFARSFTDEERAKIAAGHSITIHVAIAVEHRPGRIEPACSVLLEPPPREKENVGDHAASSAGALDNC